MGRVPDGRCQVGTRSRYNTILGTATSLISYRSFRFPVEVIGHADNAPLTQPKGARTMPMYEAWPSLVPTLRHIKGLTMCANSRVSSGVVTLIFQGKDLVKLMMTRHDAANS